MALSLERLEALCGRTDSTHWPECDAAAAGGGGARFLGGADGARCSVEIDRCTHGRCRLFRRPGSSTAMFPTSSSTEAVASEITVDGTLREADTGAAGVRFGP